LGPGQVQKLPQGAVHRLGIPENLGSIGVEKYNVGARVVLRVMLSAHPAVKSCSGLMSSSLAGLLRPMNPYSDRGCPEFENIYIALRLDSSPI
jgi:hypothetical protein